MRATQAERECRIADAMVLYEDNVAAGATTPLPYQRLGVIYRRQRRFTDEVRVLEMQRVTYVRVGLNVSGVDRRLASHVFSRRLGPHDQKLVSHAAVSRRLDFEALNEAP
jgi:hypothetical protein